MNIKIVIKAHERAEDGKLVEVNSELWAGEIALEQKEIYVAKISVIAQGEPHPICDIPFSLGEGHYLWVPPENTWPDMEEKAE